MATVYHAMQNPATAPKSDVGLIGEIRDLQLQINREWREMSPQERGQRAKEELERMPGQRYLFEGE